MADRVALVRRPSSRMAEGITTHIDRVPADAALAVRQHEAYVDAVAAAGWTIREVPPADDLPDCAFVEERWPCSAIWRCWPGQGPSSAGRRS